MEGGESRKTVLIYIRNYWITSERTGVYKRPYPSPFREGQLGKIDIPCCYCCFRYFFLDNEARFTSKSAVVLLSSTNFLPSHLRCKERPE